MSCIKFEFYQMAAGILLLLGCTELQELIKPVKLGAKKYY